MMHKLKGLHETGPNTAPHAVVQRFGPLLGKRFTRDNLPLLGRAATAVRELKRSASLIEGRDVNIFTQWVGDPDALGSAVDRQTAESLDGAQIGVEEHTAVAGIDVQAVPLQLSRALRAVVTVD